MDFPSEERMVAALVNDAIVLTLEKGGTITNIGGFTATVERRLRESEASHPGYLKLAYRARTAARPVEPVHPPTPRWQDEPIPDALPPGEIERRAREMAAKLRGVA